MVGDRDRFPARRAHRLHRCWSRSSAPSIRRPATAACWCRSSTRCWRRASPTEERTRAFARYSLIGALCDRGRLARRRRAGSPGRVGHRPDRRVQADVLRLCRARPGRAPRSTGGCRTRRCARPRPSTPLGPSRGIVYKLAALFSLDSFAGGFVVQSLLALWLFERFDLSLVGRQPVLLLVERAERVLLSGRGLARAGASA